LKNIDLIIINNYDSKQTIIITMQIDWNINDNYIIARTHNKSLIGCKIAAFDLDHTLIKPSNGKKFSDNDDDWEIFDKQIMNKLKELQNNDYYLVIISNQKGISNGKVNIETFKSKIEKIINFFCLDFVILCAIEDDLYRKPRTGLWDKFIKGNTKTSFYCGDAAGLKGDFSDSDYKFALNIGLKFIYISEFISGKKQKLDQPSLPFNIQDNSKNKHIFVPNHQEVIINVGFPGSGKSYFTKKCVIYGYIQVNQDTLKTKIKCLKLFESSIKDGKSVVVDNVNITKDQRKAFLDIAKKYNIKCRCIHFTTPKEVCIHNAYFRNFITDGNIKPIPNLVFNIMNKKFQEPELSEGFYVIDKLPFVIDLPDNLLNTYTKFFY